MCLLNWFHLLDLWATGPFQSKISCSSEPESLFILIRVCSSLSLSLFFFFSLTPSLPLSLPCSLFLQEGLLISPENHLMFLTEGEQQRRDTLYSQECHLNLAIPRPEDTHVHTHMHTHTHTMTHTHTHECTHVHTHSSYFLHTLSHTQTLLHTHLWGHFTDLLHCLNLKPLDDWTFALVLQSNREKWLNRRTKKTTNFVHFYSFVWGFFSKQRNLWSYRIGLK